MHIRVKIIISLFWVSSAIIRYYVSELFDWQRSGEPGLTAAFDGYNCKIICLRRKKQTALPSSSPPSPSFYPSSTSLPSSSSSSSSSSSTSQTSTPSSTTTFAGYLFPLFLFLSRNLSYSHAFPPSLSSSICLYVFLFYNICFALLHFLSTFLHSIHIIHICICIFFCISNLF